MTDDVLSDVLRAVRLSGAVFFRVEAREPWVAEAPPAAHAVRYVLPRAQHMMEYHVIREGRAWAGLPGAPPLALEAGDVIAFPQGDPHVLSSGPGMRHPPDLAPYRAASAAPRPYPIVMGGEGPPSVRLICGFLGFDSRPFNPLLEALPRVMHLRTRAQHDRSWLDHLIEAAVTEATQPRAGGESVVARLSELLLLELVRRHVEAMPPEATGWLAGLRDPHVGRALNLLHERAAEDWTLDVLAREVGLSRSALAERFAQLVGVPPMQYLARWRMQRAAGLLAEGRLQVAQVAAEVGYESEAAFSRAFHRLVGMPPTAWRRARAAGPAPADAATPTAARAGTPPPPPGPAGAGSAPSPAGRALG